MKFQKIIVNGEPSSLPVFFGSVSPTRTYSYNVLFNTSLSSLVNQTEK